MNILITGGTGFIGSQLALACIKKKHSVTVLGQENTDAEMHNRQVIESKGAKVVLGSVTDVDCAEEACKGVDWIFHLAAAQHEANVPDEHFRAVNVAGTRNLLEACSKAGVKRFIHGSTIGVYGDSLEGTISEGSPLKPNNIYGMTKLEAEKLVETYGDRLQYVINRISETYGPGDRRLLKLFKAIKKNLFFMIGSGTNIHHLIFIDDLIEGLLMTASMEAANGNIFILAGKDALTTNEMVARIAEYFGTKIPRFNAPLSLFYLTAVAFEAIFKPFGLQPPLHRRRMDFFKKSFRFSQNHAKSVLGFTPLIEFNEGVRKTAEWYQKMGLLN